MHIKKVHFLAILRKAFKKGLLLRILPFFTQKKSNFYNFYPNFSKNQGEFNPPFQNSGGVATPPTPLLWRPCISGNILTWCEDFLTNRQAHLSFQGACSTIKEFENGTPQRSCLSPCLFNYAMNVFLKLKLPPGVKMLIYADDIVLYCDTHSNPMKQLQTALDLLTHTATDAGFMFAPAKTKAMCFFAGNPETQLKINNQQIEWTDDHNYLGVIIDKQLRFHKHVEHIADRTQSASNALKVLGSLSGLSCSLLRRVFMATVRPIIDYGAEIHMMSAILINMYMKMT